MIFNEAIKLESSKLRFINFQWKFYSKKEKYLLS